MLWRHHDHNSWNTVDSATWIRKQISTSTIMFLCYELCHSVHFGDMLPPLSGLMQGQKVKKHQAEPHHILGWQMCGSMNCKNTAFVSGMYLTVLLICI